MTDEQSGYCTCGKGRLFLGEPYDYEGIRHRADGPCLQIEPAPVSPQWTFRDGKVMIVRSRTISIYPLDEIRRVRGSAEFGFTFLNIILASGYIDEIDDTTPQQYDELVRRLKEHHFPSEPDRDPSADVPDILWPEGGFQRGDVVTVDYPGLPTDGWNGVIQDWDADRGVGSYLVEFARPIAGVLGAAMWLRAGCLYQSKRPVLQDVKVGDRVRILRHMATGLTGKEGYVDGFHGSLVRITPGDGTYWTVPPEDLEKVEGG